MTVQSNLPRREVAGTTRPIPPAHDSDFPSHHNIILLFVNCMASLSGYSFLSCNRHEAGSWSARIRRLQTSASALLAMVFAVGALEAQGIKNGTGAVADQFQMLCAGCHGENMEGSLAPSLLDEEWLHGGDDASLARSIRLGFPNRGMPPWESTLSESEIRALVILIHEIRAKHRQSHSEFPKGMDSFTAASLLHSFHLNTWVTGLEQPWSLAFIDGDSALVTEKRGQLHLVEAGKLEPISLSGLREVDTKGQGGLFSVALHPNYRTNGWVYLSYADLRTTGTTAVSMTRIVRGRIRGREFVETEKIFQAPLDSYRPAGGEHFGGRLVFDTAGFLYFSIGERGDGANAQMLNRPTGKIHRILDDGSVPNDNPFAHHQNAAPSIWSIGHRNPQGLAIDPETGQLYGVEHGPRGGDEVNLIRPGANYGWPVVTSGMNYDGTPMAASTSKDGMEEPAITWVPSIAPSGANFYQGDLFPRWRGNLFVASLRAQELHRLEVQNGRVIEDEVVLKGQGRIRDVVGGPDGAIYVLLPERIARIAPAPKAYTSDERP